MKQGTLLPHLRSPADEHLVVCALASELPEMLPERILFTGVGKINAAYVLTRYLTTHPEVKSVINYGTGGAAHQVKKGDLVQCTTFLQGDMDCGDLVDGPGITYGDDKATEGVIQFGTEGKICRTQDQFITDVDTLDMFQHLVMDNKFNVVDMEAYALAKVCTQMGKDFHCFKYISDDAEENAGTDWQDNVAKGEPLFYDILRSYFHFTHIQ
tara:strand:- start:777 stop:1412 length:636 start_codon:yes stop_codon:yes gene_type:complete